MSLTTEEKDLQNKILTTKTSENESMAFNPINARNTGLNPDYFPGALSKIVNAINASYERAESARQYGMDLYNKFAEIILDTAGSYGQEKLSEMIEKTGQATLIEGVVKICDQLASGEGVNITQETIINALGYEPIKEPTYILGVELFDDESI